MATEQKLGTVTDYYAKIGVAALDLSEGELQVGDHVRFKGHSTDFTQAIESLQVEHQPVLRAARGSQAAVKVRERVRRNDQVLRVADG
jgi:putative protease